MKKFLTIVIAFAALAVSTAFAAEAHKSSNFSGAKANKGFVTQTNENGNSTLTLSDDFVVPETPDPHWEVVDSQGNVYVLDKLKISALIGDKVKKSITVPAYVKDVKKIVIWCAYAEANLGEASFASAVK